MWKSKENWFALKIKDIEKHNIDKETKLWDRFENEFDSLKWRYEQKITELSEALFDLKKQIADWDTEQKMKLIELGMRNDFKAKEEKQNILDEISKIKHKLLLQKEAEIKQIREWASLDLELYAMEMNSRHERDLINVEQKVREEERKNLRKLLEDKHQTKWMKRMAVVGKRNSHERTSVNRTFDESSRGYGKTTLSTHTASIMKMKKDSERWEKERERG